jgi:hypothetical protein
MIISEQAITQSSDVFRGQNTLKAGGIVSASDPLAFLGSGTDVGAYLLLEPSKLFSFINLDKSFFGREINYDLGVFGTTKLLPVALSTEYMQRGIAASDSFTDFSFGKPEMKEIKYTATLRDLDLYATHPVGDGMKINILGSYNWYDIFMDTKDLFGADFPYTLAQGYRLGSFFTLLAPEMDSRSEISPRGLYAKAFYYYWKQQLLSEDKGITFENGYPKENYDNYLYHEAGFRTKFGMSSPWYDQHDIYAEINFSSMIPNGQIMNRLQGKADSVRNVPSYYKEVAWVPGYTYYYEQKRAKENDQQFMDTLKYDTLLVTGNAVSLVNLSYRFPLWPKPLIDSKLWFIYFSKMYGAVNFSAGAGWEHASDVLKFEKKNWLSSAGLELRLETIAFGYIPLDIKFRWDRGLNRPAPIGGDRFTLGIGLSFDNWEYIDVPDYRTPAQAMMRSR